MAHRADQLQLFLPGTECRQYSPQRGPRRSRHQLSVSLRPLITVPAGPSTVQPRSQRSQTFEVAAERVAVGVVAPPERELLGALTRLGEQALLGALQGQALCSRSGASTWTSPRSASAETRAASPPAWTPSSLVTRRRAIRSAGEKVGRGERI